MADSNSFTSHFVELRSRLIKSLVFIFVTFIISYTFAEYIYSFLEIFLKIENPVPVKPDIDSK